MVALLAAVWSTPKRLLGVCSGAVWAAFSSAVTERTSPWNTMTVFSQTPSGSLHDLAGQEAHLRYIQPADDRDHR